MYKIVAKRMLQSNICLMDVEAKRCAHSFLPGQFLVVKMDEKGERIPLTICDVNKEKGLITIVFQTVGDSTNRMALLEVGDYFEDVAGPLGNPSELVEKSKEELQKMNIVFIAGGVGAAPVYPQVKYLHEIGVDCDVIIGARSKDILILDEEMGKVCKNLYLATDDGSLGFHGNASQCLEDLVKNKGEKYDHAVIIGPMIMMKFTTMMTKSLGIPTVVSLNSIMVDATGMCGACRVSVGKEVKFTCVDGPEFDGYEVNFDEAMRRQTMYKTEEGKKLLRQKDKGTHGKNPYCDCKEEE